MLEHEPDLKLAMNSLNEVKKNLSEEEIKMIEGKVENEKEVGKKFKIQIEECSEESDSEQNQ